MHTALGYLDAVRRTLRTADTLVHLTPRELQVLIYLHQEQGRTVPATELATQVWQYHPGSQSSAIRIGVARLLKKLTVHGCGDGIEVHGSDGYRMPMSNGLVGRASLLERVDAQIRTGHALLLGPGGIGKTAIARAIAAPFGTNALWVDVGSSGQSPRRLLAALLNVEPQNVAETLRADPPLLVVFDEVERIDEEYWSHLLDEVAAPVLLTSRAPVLDFPSILVPALSPQASRQLFLREQARPTESGLSTEILQSFGGNPALLILGARWVQRCPSSPIPASLGAQLPERTWELLRPLSQRAALRLRCLQGNFAMEELAALADAESLLDLTDLGWLHDGSTRLHTRVREFLKRECGAPSEEQKAAHRSWIVEKAEKVALGVGEGRVAPDALRPLYRDLHWAFEHCSSPSLRERLALIMAHDGSGRKDEQVRRLAQFGSASIPTQLSLASLRCKSSDREVFLPAARTLLDRVPISARAARLAFTVLECADLTQADTLIEEWKQQGRLTDPYAISVLMELRTYLLSRDGRIAESLTVCRSVYERYDEWDVNVAKGRALAKLLYQEAWFHGADVAYRTLEQLKSDQAYPPRVVDVGDEVYGALIFAESLLGLHVGHHNTPLAMESVQRARRLHRPNIMAYRAPSLAHALAIDGDFEQAHYWVDRATNILQQMQLRQANASATAARALVWFWQGHAAEAMDCLRCGDELASDGSDLQFWIRLMQAAADPQYDMPDCPNYPHATRCWKVTAMWRDGQAAQPPANFAFQAIGRCTGSAPEASDGPV